MKKVLSIIFSLALIVSVMAFPFETNAITLADDELPVDGWTFLTSSTNANNGVPQEKPENVIDGSAVTHWHTTINPKAEGPHFITVVLPTVQKIGGYRYTPRSNMGAGTCTKYEISVSLDNVNYEKVAEGTWAYNAQAKNVYFNKDVEARYVKLTILEGVGGFGSAAEIRLLSPKEGTDGMIYNYTELDVELPVTGWQFLASSTNANNGVPAEVPENVIDGNTRTHWHTMINPKAEPPHYLTIVLPEITEIGGYRYYPRASGPAGVCSKYEIYASLDNVHFEKLAAGEWSTSTEKKTVYFSKNVRAKYVRLQILKGTYDFGSAGEIRLMAPNPQKKTEDLVANFMFEDASSGKAELGQTGWSVVASSVNTDINGNVLEKAENLIDGDVNSFWITKTDPKAEGPHEVTVIFPGVISMSGYRYYPRAIGLAGICTKYELYASDNGTEFYQIASGDWAGNNDAKTIEFVCNLKAKALRLVMLESFGGYGSGGEIKILAPDDGLSTITPAEYYAESQKYVINGYVFDGTKIHTLGETNLIAHRMIDGAESSNWYSPVTVGGEQTRLDVEFPYSYTLKGIRYLGRQDGHTAGNFKKIKVQASNDAKTYQDVGEYSLEVKSTPIDVNFNTDVTAKYLRITVLEGQDNYAACAEISFLQNAKQHQDDSLKDEEKYVLQIGSNAIHVTKAGVTKTVTIDAAPYIYQSSTMIPLRGLLEEMGCAVTWSGETETIEVKSNFDLMKFSIENPTVLINGGRYASPVAPQITESRTYIPLRFVSENLGYNVYWNGDTREITISTK